MRLVTASALAAVVLGGCAQAGGGADARIDVVASFYPLAFAAQRIGGDRVSVRNLTPSGAEPHDLELTPGQVASIGRADLVLYLSGGFQPAVEDAVPRSRVSLDARAAIGAQPGPDASDPHLWLDPTRMMRIGRVVAARLAALDPGGAGDYRRRAAALEDDLANLDRAFRSGLATCQRHEIVTSHAAFGYLAGRYGLRQIPISGIDPEAEPTRRRLAEIVALVRRYRVTTVFSETLLSARTARTIAREAGVRTDVLDPVEGVRGADTYVTVMNRNLQALRRALGCR